MCRRVRGSVGQAVVRKARERTGSGDRSEFWVRTGNATKQLHGDDMVEYHEEHWG